MHLFGNAIQLECFLSKVAGSLRMKHFMKAYLRKPYNAIQITFDGSLLGGLAASFPFVSSSPVWWPLPCLGDPGNTGTSWGSGLQCTGQNCYFFGVLWIIVSQMKLLLESLFPRQYDNSFHSKREQIEMCLRFLRKCDFWAVTRSNHLQLLSTEKSWYRQSLRAWRLSHRARAVCLEEAVATQSVSVKLYAAWWASAEQISTAIWM